MTTPSVAPSHRRPPLDAGMTMIEVLVAMGLFTVVGSLLLGFALSTADITDDIQASGDLTGEARIAMERMARELRQARAIDAVQFHSETVTTTAITFWTDFDGDGVRDLGAVDPEVLTYRWEPGTAQLTLTADDVDGTAITRPILAGNVQSFDLQLRSSLWQYDTSADGVATTWTELDAAGAPVGNVNARPDGPELGLIDLVAVRLVVADGEASQTFSFQTDLRNRSQT
ncbi:type II secretion system protein J [Nocardioides sp.]|uniref:PulJ/GspJ family protein n=1 Tax=Nocardioides sp. TaxID=35761 RepID=UPI0027365437|nr:prepilin-type N-terminal cleavage/methylation domain-containing protein [Nocardioides sp.]MDP3894873.1 prepilin-type N-terminal cleavage/methylation domain-containing protein [Nocardioides sp.]